jgi:DNA-binding LytR/AlgR family response regulator
MKINCLLIDDEALALDVLESYVRLVPPLHLVGRCNNVLAALDHLQHGHQVDVLFLDIHMPVLSGIEWVKTIVSPPKIIFTTAFREYAAESYELNAVDYLLKPIAFDRFVKAINKVIEGNKGTENSAPAEAARQPGGEAPYLYVKADKKVIKVPLRDILYVEGVKDYLRIRTTERDIITYHTLTSFEAKLPPAQFLRVHRSYIVAVDKIHACSATSLEIGDKLIPIGRLYKQQVFQTLQLKGL